jgi:NADH:ubiquinone oxidoreductase subunit
MSDAMATLGTVLFTLAKGRLVGTDPDGNRYFTERRPRPGLRARRWVIYKGPAEASRVPPEWHAWLHHTSDEPLNGVARWPWQKPHRPNMTGTPEARLPQGHDLAGGQRQKATGDYEAWTP